MEKLTTLSGKNDKDLFERLEMYMDCLLKERKEFGD